MPGPACASYSPRSPPATPQLGELFDEIYPQIEQQMRSGITEEFELLAKQNKINEKLLALEELLEAAENVGVAEAPPIVRPLPEGMTPEDVLRRQTHELKQRELERCSLLLHAAP